MTLPPVLLLGVLCFGAGWGLDVWLRGGGEEEPALRPRIATMARGPVSDKPGAPSLTTAAETGAAPSAKSLEQLLHLAQGVPYATGRARAERAIARLTDAELHAAGEEMRAWLTAHPYKSLPPQIMDPLLQRWLTVEPLAALKTAAEFWDFVTEETEPFFMSALARQARERWDDATPLMRKLGTQRKWNAVHEAVKDLPPQDAVPKILNVMEGQDRHLDDHRWQDQVTRWIAEDAPQAVHWALSLPPDEARRSLLQFMAEAWGARDAREAYLFLNNTPQSILPAGRLRKNLSDAIQMGELNAAYLRQITPAGQ